MLRPQLLTLLLLGSLTSGCGTYSVRGDRSIQPTAPTVQNIDFPTVGQTKSVEVGESLIKRERLAAVPAIDVLEEASTVTDWMGSSFRISVLPGRYSQVGIDPRGAYYQAVAGNFRINEKSAGRGGIYVPNSNPSETELYTFNPLGVLLIYPRQGIALKATRTSLPVAGGFRRELIYSGTSKNTLSLLYREFLDDLLRPAFSQELKYDLSEATVIGYKGARFEVISANNTEITYRVVRALGPVIN
jgi:hypothetical protein